MATLHPMRLPAGADTLYAEVVRDPATAAAPPVVLCHGAGGNHVSWFQQVPHLARRFGVLTWDQRGFGSSTDHAGLASPGQAVEDLHTILQAAGAGRVHLVGQSLGGWAAVGYALAHPAAVASVVLASSVGGLLTDAVRRSLDRYLADRTRTDGAPRQLGAHPALAADLGERDETRAFLYQQIAGFATLAPVEAIAKIRHTSHDALRLARLGIPTLFVVGERDHIFTPEAVAEVAASLPDAQLHVIAGAGHSAYFERPEAFNAAVTDFLTGVP